MSVNQEKIVRIMTEGQFRVDSQTIELLDVLDNKIVDLVEKMQKFDEDDDSKEMKEIYENITKMNEIVTSKGKKIEQSEIVASDIIIPDTDISLNELKNIFSGEGLIKDS